MINFKMFLESKTFTLPTPGLNIHRKDMPQIEDKHMTGFFEFLKSKGGKIVKTKMKASDLKPTQRNFNVDGVAAMENHFRTNKEKSRKPLIVSSDNYIIDGHHRWLAAKNLGMDIPVVHVTNISLKKLLEISHDFPHVVYKSVGNKRIDK